MSSSQAVVARARLSEVGQDCIPAADFQSASENLPTTAELSRQWHRFIAVICLTSMPSRSRFSSHGGWREVFPGVGHTPAETNSGQAFLAMDSLLDEARTGPMYLRRPEIAQIVVIAFRYGQEKMGLYERHAWVVMPNHVHLLITPLVKPSMITQSLKLLHRPRGE